MRVTVPLLLLAALVLAPPLGAQDAPVYVAYYWRAQPGALEEYNRYIREVAEPIDEEARQAGVFEELRTYTPMTEGTDWTHLRVFKLKNAAAADALSAGLDAATRRLYPEEAQRKANSERSAPLRVFVRQERWTELR